MKHEIVLDGRKLSERRSAHAWLQKEFAFPEYYGANLDALNDCLSEVSQDTEIVLTKENLDEICRSSYAYQILLVMSKAAEENPHLQIRFHK